MSTAASPPGRPTRRVRVIAPLALVLMLGPILAACGGDSDMSSSSERAPVRADAQPADGGGAREAGGGSSADSGADAGGAQSPGGDSAATSSAALTGRQVIRTASVTVEVKDLTAAAAAARSLGPSLGGLVASEKSQRPDATDSPGPTGAGESVIELRVPERRLDEALNRLAALGRERGRAVTSEDVTAQIADLDGRVATQRQALVRVRQLLSRAATVKDILELEQELTRRESDLEGLQRRVAALRGQAQLSTVTVTLVTPATPVEEAEGSQEPRTGFVGGLKGGWDALTATFVVVSAIVGALLPWAVPAAVVLAVVVLVRRRWGARIGAWRQARQRYPVRGGSTWPVPPVPVSTTPAAAQHPAPVTRPEPQQPRSPEEKDPA